MYHVKSNIAPLLDVVHIYSFNEDYGSCGQLSSVTVIELK